MANSYDLCIICPDKIVYEAKVVSIVVPADLGYLGVLAGHAPLAANLAAGKIIIKETPDKTVTYRSKAKGFLQVLKNSVNVILTESSPLEAQNA